MMVSLSVAAQGHVGPLVGPGSLSIPAQIRHFVALVQSNDVTQVRS
jgi:hypothetical protein